MSLWYVAHLITYLDLASIFKIQKIRFRLQVESYISDWLFSESRLLASYVSRHKAMAYDNPGSDAPQSVSVDHRRGRWDFSRNCRQRVEEDGLQLLCRVADCRWPCRCRRVFPSSSMRRHCRVVVVVVSSSSCRHHHVVTVLLSSSDVFICITLLQEGR